MDEEYDITGDSPTTEPTRAHQAAEGGKQDNLAMATFWGETRGMGVLDCGATETIASIASIEALIEDRSERLGYQHCSINAKVNRRFRFGNGQGQCATSEATLLLASNEKPVTLSINTLDVENVPVLLSVKTMERMGAVIDFARGQAIFEKINPGKVVKLHRASTGHLMVDLRCDLAECAPTTCDTAAPDFATQAPGLRMMSQHTSTEDVAQVLANDVQES